MREKMRMKMGVMLTSLTLVLSACASSNETATSRVTEDAYVPTGSNIPRKSAARDSNVIMSKDAAEQALRTAPSSLSTR
jgi:type IV pilus biogenesis protein CpaD/CtpE